MSSTIALCGVAALFGTPRVPEAGANHAKGAFSGGGIARKGHFAIFLFFVCVKNGIITEHGKMPFLHDSPPLPAIRLWRPGCPFRVIRPPPCPKTLTAPLPDAFQGSRGKSRKRGIQGAGGESRIEEANRLKKAFCHVLL